MIHHRTRWRHATRRQRARGQILVLFAFMLVALLAASALAVDYGGWLLTRRTYQNVADAAALAGANQLTSEITDPCLRAGTGGESKNTCAKEASWTFIKNALHFTDAQLDPFVQSNKPVSAGSPFTADGYRIWVASPPAEAGTAYFGQFSTPQTIYVRVERDQPTNVGRIVHPQDTTISAWATAGRVPKNFAILTLCRPDASAHPPESCLANLADIRVNGQNSSIVIEDGDLGNNTWTTTNATGSAVALAPDSNAYMGRVDLCWATPNKCQMAGWDNVTQSRSGTRSAFPLGPQIVDPAYNVPTMSGTAVPWQCVDLGFNAGPIALAPDAGPRTAVEQPPIVLAADVQPLPTPNAAPNASPTKVTGTITDASTGLPISGATVIVTSGPGAPYASVTTGAAGTYSVTVTTGGTFGVTASKAGYSSASGSVAVATGNSTPALNLALGPNPGTISGTVTSSIGGAIVGASVMVTGGGTATSGASGAYSVLNVTPGLRTVTASAAGYSPQTLTVSVPPGGVGPLNFVLVPSGSVSGTVADAVSGNPLSGATVTIVGQGSTATLANGTYVLSPVAPGTYTVTASMSGYTSVSKNNIKVNAGANTPNVNFMLTPTGGNLTGTVTDSMTTTPIAGATVAITGGLSRVTNASGVYTFTGIPVGTYDMTATALGYFDGSARNVTVNAGLTTTKNVALGPSTCNRNNNGSYTNANWVNCQSGASLDGCAAPKSPSGQALDVAPDVTCSRFDATNRIRPGTYNNITLPNNSCAWIDPTPSTGMTTGQLPGVVHVTGQLSIGSGAFIVGDGVTIVMDTTAQLTVGNSGGFVLNFASVYNTVTGTCDLSTVAGKDETHKCFRTVGGVNAPRPYNATACPSGHQKADYTYGAWTTKTSGGGPGPWGTVVAGTPPTYDDCSLPAGSIGLTWYLRSSGSNTYSSRFSPSSQYGFLFMGVLYGPRDNIGLSGQGGQASAGQIVAWTITYSGGTTIYQRYTGLKEDGPAYLLEPTLGQ